MSAAEESLAMAKIVPPRPIAGAVWNPNVFQVQSGASSSYCPRTSWAGAEEGKARRMARAKRREGHAARLAIIASEPHFTKNLGRGTRGGMMRREVRMSDERIKQAFSTKSNAF